MKRQFLMLIAIAAFASALTTDALGQTGKAVRANIKFDFQIGDHTYPAGEYRLESTSGESYAILHISSVSEVSKQQFIVASHSSAGKSQTPKLVFQKYGENYFLTKIFLDTDQRGYSIRPSRRQRESEKHLASRITRNN